MAKSKKNNTQQNIKNMSADEITKNILDAENKLKRMKFSHAITPIENPMAIKMLRREIAQLKTQQTLIQQTIA